MGKKLTNKDIYFKLENEFNNEYIMIGDYKGSIKPITLKHICGYIYTIKRAKTFLKENGGRCPICCDKRKEGNKHIKSLSKEDFIKRIYTLVNEEYSYISGYINTSTKVLMKHNKCNNTWSIRPNDFLYRNRRCPICANKNRGKYAIKDNYLNDLIKDEKDYQWLEDYKGNNKIKHKMKHLSCGKEFYIRPNDFQQGYRCPHCNNKSNNSNQELELLDFIKNNYDGKIISNYRDKLEIDIFIPNLNIGFEFNGYYWHSDKFKDKNYHLNKYNYFIKKNIHLYFIDEIDWFNKKDLIKLQILHLIDLENKPKIIAEKCNIKFNLSFDKQLEFLNKYQIDNNLKNYNSIYLLYNNCIISLLRYSINKNKLKIEDYVENLNFNVIDGFKILIKELLNKFTITEIYTIIDKNSLNENIFINNKFNLSYISEPSYYYVYNKHKILNDYKLKEILDKNNLSIDNEISNLYKIYNLGYNYYNIKC